MALHLQIFKIKWTAIANLAQFSEMHAARQRVKFLNFALEQISAIYG